MSAYTLDVIGHWAAFLTETDGGLPNLGWKGQGYLPMQDRPTLSRRMSVFSARSERRSTGWIPMKSPSAFQSFESMIWAGRHSHRTTAGSIHAPSCADFGRRRNISA
jgi:hypothetical protein